MSFTATNSYFIIHTFVTQWLKPWYIKGLHHQRPNWLKLNRVLKLGRCSTMVGSTRNCFQCFEIWVGAQLEPVFVVQRRGLSSLNSASGFQNIWLRKFEFVTKAQFLWSYLGWDYPVLSLGLKYELISSLETILPKPVFRPLGNCLDIHVLLF